MSLDVAVEWLRTLAGPLRALAGTLSAGLASLSATTGLDPSVLRFAAAMVAVVPVSLAHRYIRPGTDAKARHWYGAATGTALLVLAFGSDVGRFFAAAAAVYLFMKWTPAHCGYLTWATIFSAQVYL